MSTNVMAGAILAALAMLCAFGSSTAQSPPVQPAAPGGAPVGQFANQPANNASLPAGPPQIGLGQAGGSAPINKIISPPNSGLPAPTQTAGAGANSNLVDPVGNTSRSKRQAGIPPVCCTKDPCDPCATTPCIACPLCG